MSDLNFFDLEENTQTNKKTLETLKKDIVLNNTLFLEGRSFYITSEKDDKED